MVTSKAKAASLLSAPDDIEAQFYEALQQADLERLMAVWADDDEVFCVHPGGPRVIGLAAIRTTFAAIFSNGAIPVQAEQVRRVQSETSAVHSVIERVHIGTAQGGQTAWVLATNVYVKTMQGWRMVAHHASPGTQQEPPEITEAPTVLH
jgi:uncharacterized protein (TIGR02246 family)